jgi:hypothetical protein
VAIERVVCTIRDVVVDQGVTRRQTTRDFTFVPILQEDCSRYHRQSSNELMLCLLHLLQMQGLVAYVLELHTFSSVIFPFD